MPIPFLLIGVGAGTAALGVGTIIKAGIDQNKANKANQSASDTVKRWTDIAETSRENCGRAIEDLGRKKVWVLDNSINRFINLFEQLHNVKLKNSLGMDELRKFRINQQSFAELKQMSITAETIAEDLASGTVAGALVAIGAYSGANAFGIASTGAAISSLSGAAASNATLAFLGGGALSVGGLGMAGGTAVLGGLVAGPALAVMGVTLGAKASANKDTAYSNLAQASKYAEEVKTLQCLCKAIRMRANMFERLLIRLDAIFEPLVENLAQIIQTSGTDFSEYNRSEKAVVAANLSIAKAIKAILDTPILTEDGNLTQESEAVIVPIQKVIAAHEDT